MDKKNGVVCKNIVTICGIIDENTLARTIIIKKSCIFHKNVIPLRGFPYLHNYSTKNSHIYLDDITRSLCGDVRASFRAHT